MGVPCLLCDFRDLRVVSAREVLRGLAWECEEEGRGLVTRFGRSGLGRWIAP